MAYAESYVSALLMDSDSPPNGGLPPDQAYKYQGPWLATQLTLSISIGLASFLFFCFARRVEKWRVLYSPRTLLKGFSPHEVHTSESFFGWVLPTLRASEFTVLQIVGLDAAVLLSFFRAGFLFFLSCSIMAAFVLVPINYRENGTSEGVDPSVPTNSTRFAAELAADLMYRKPHLRSNLYLTCHLCFAYFFSVLALVFLQRTWARYIPLRQLFSLELAHSIPARTVMITALPPHLRSERAIAEYFENIHLGVSSEEHGLTVESVDIVRAVGGMKELLERRTRALHRLENAWVSWLGNPVPTEGKGQVFGYDPVVEVSRIAEPASAPSPDDAADDQSPSSPTTRSSVPEGRLVDVPRSHEDDVEEHDDLEAALLAPSRPTIVSPSKPRPKLRPHLFAKKVDALEYYAEQFRVADDDVKRRRAGRFRPTGVAFVTFQSLAAAQVAAQVVHYPSATAFKTELAPEPRDINWNTLTLSGSSVFVRRLLASLTVLVLLSVWSIPVAFLARLLSWETIEEAAPKLAAWIGKSPRLRGFVQTSLPSLAMVAFNNFLPFFLESLAYFQGLPARSWIEYSLLKKYHISIHFTTLFVFITSSTYSLLQELSESPANVLSKLATTLPGARNFFVSYVMLSGVALMPLQLLELAVVIPRMFFRAFVTTTPRDFAELNAPPTLNLGTVYPQALLIFTLGLTYSIISPIILPFTTLYFGLAYLVYKYKLLFVYYRPFESRGQAWPIAFNRIVWGLLIFQVFMLGLFIVRKAFLLGGLMVPLIIGTIFTSLRIGRVYAPLSRFVNLSQACEIASGHGSDVLKLRRGSVTRSQTNLQRSRYGHSDEGVYVVAPNRCTDYSQPPLSGSYPGILNTGRRRYGHPALSGVLPEPWLPGLAEPSLSRDVPEVVKAALVVDLKRRWSVVKRAARTTANAVPGIHIPEPSSSTGRRRGGSDGGEAQEDYSRAWRSQSPEDPPIIENDMDGILSDDEDELEQGQGMTRYQTFFPHHPSRNRGRFPVSFPPTNGDASETDEES